MICDYAENNLQNSSSRILSLAENQAIDILDRQDPRFYLIRTKPSKITKTKIGWIPSCFIEKRKGSSIELDSNKHDDDSVRYQKALINKK
jgi:hypothetical protein